MYDNAMTYDIHSEERYHLYSIIIELTGRKVPQHDSQLSRKMQFSFLLCFLAAFKQGISKRGIPSTKISFF